MLETIKSNVILPFSSAATFNTRTSSGISCLDFDGEGALVWYWCSRNRCDLNKMTDISYPKCVCTPIQKTYF